MNYPKSPKMFSFPSSLLLIKGGEHFDSEDTPSAFLSLIFKTFCSFVATSTTSFLSLVNQWEIILSSNVSVASIANKPSSQTSFRFNKHINTQKLEFPVNRKQLPRVQLLIYIVDRSCQLIFTRLATTIFHCQTQTMPI